MPGLLDLEGFGLLSARLFTVEGMPVGLFTYQPLRWGAAFLFPGEGGLLSSAQVSPVTALGLVALLIVLARPGLRGVLLALALPSLVVSVGPVLLVGDTGLPNPLYNALVMALPPLRRLWFPERALFLFALAQALAVEWAPYGIRINCVLPGPIATEGLAVYSDAARAGLARGNPLRRLGDVQDVAEACVYLSAASGKFITGEVLVVDGGHQHWGELWMAGRPDGWPDADAAG